MKNLLFFYFILSCSISLFSQEKVNIIYYGVLCTEDEAFKSIGKEAYELYKEEVESQDFEMIFNDSISQFNTVNKINNKLPLQNICKSIKHDYAVKIKKEEKIGIIMDRNIQWTIISKKKNIQDYTCYKATSSFSVTRGDRTFTFPLIAWFCPEIPYNFGPLGYGGLPGLILELQERNILYGAKKIEFNSTKNKIINHEISNLNKYTQAEWDELMMNKMLDAKN